MATAKAKYPHRPHFFAHRFCRLVSKVCLVHDVGPTAVLLLHEVAHQEDACRYRKAITYRNSHLMNLLGIKKCDTLARIRKDLASLGWLHYENRGSRKPGIYWVTVPDEFADFDDAPIRQEGERSYPANGDDKRGSYPANGDDKRGSYPANGDDRGDPSTLTLTLRRSSDDERARSKKSKRKYSDRFEQWWSIYPRKVGKLKASKLLPKAIADLANGRTKTEAFEHLLDITRRFAASPKGRGEFCPYPATWLSQGRYEDDPATWCSDAHCESRGAKSRSELGRYRTGRQLPNKFED